MRAQIFRAGPSLIFIALIRWSSFSKRRACPSISCALNSSAISWQPAVWPEEVRINIQQLDVIPNSQSYALTGSEYLKYRPEKQMKFIYGSLEFTPKEENIVWHSENKNKYKIQVKQFTWNSCSKNNIKEIISKRKVKCTN